MSWFYVPNAIIHKLCTRNSFAKSQHETQNLSSVSLSKFRMSAGVFSRKTILLSRHGTSSITVRKRYMFMHLYSINWILFWEHFQTSSKQGVHLHMFDWKESMYLKQSGNILCYSKAFEQGPRRVCKQGSQIHNLGAHLGASLKSKSTSPVSQSAAPPDKQRNSGQEVSQCMRTCFWIVVQLRNLKVRMDHLNTTYTLLMCLLYVGSPRHLSPYIYIYVYIHTHIYIYIYVCVCMCIYTHTHVCLCNWEHHLPCWLAKYRLIPGVTQEDV